MNMATEKKNEREKLDLKSLGVVDERRLLRNGRIWKGN
jgi:hypothetical protein